MIRLQRIVLALAACALLNVGALAGTKGKSVEFAKDVKVGGSVVKRGVYAVKFDEQTSELTIMSGNKVVARSAAKLEDRKGGSKYASVYSTVKVEDGSELLLSVNMGGQNAVIGEATTAAERLSKSAPSSL